MELRDREWLATLVEDCASDDAANACRIDGWVKLAKAIRDGKDDFPESFWIRLRFEIEDEISQLRDKSNRLHELEHGRGWMSHQNSVSI